MRRLTWVVYQEVIYYFAETKQEKVKLSYEHVGYIWLPYEDALRQLTFENAKNVLRKAHAHINKL